MNTQWEAFERLPNLDSHGYVNNVCVFWCLEVLFGIVLTIVTEKFKRFLSKIMMWKLMIFNHV